MISLRKSLSVGTPGSLAAPFNTEITTNKKGEMVAIIDKQSVIYKSFNLKDIMIAKEYLDKETESLITKEEKNTDRHVIKKLGEELPIFPNSVIYIELEIEVNLMIKSAEIKVGPESAKNNPQSSDPPWKSYPEIIGFDPPLEYDSDGSIKDSSLPRRQKYAYIPISYFSPNLELKGKNVSFSNKTEPVSQILVQILKDNIIMQIFNYDGYPVTYGIPFFGGTYLYFPPGWKPPETQ
jgi:hypothetical protein